MTTATRSVCRFLTTAAAVLFSAASVSAATLTVYADKTASVGSEPAGQDVDGDNRLRSYVAEGLRIDGWMSFDVSTLTDSVSVTSARLTLYAEGNLAASPFTSVQGTPHLEVWHSTHDGWERGGNGFPANPDSTRLAGPDVGPFPVVTQLAYEIELLTSPEANWTSFLADGELSLVLRLANPVNEEHWVYWYGSGERPGDNTVGGHAGNDPVGPEGYGLYAPRLVLQYDVVPEPSVVLLASVGGAFAVRRRKVGRSA